MKPTPYIGYMPVPPVYWANSSEGVGFAGLDDNSL